MPVHVLLVNQLICRWHTLNTGPFVAGLVIVFVYSMLSVGFSKLKPILINILFTSKASPIEYSYKAFDALMFAINMLLKYSIMILMMTMNGWVNIVLAFGMMTGYAVFLMNAESKR